MSPIHFSLPTQVFLETDAVAHHAALFARGKKAMIVTGRTVGKTIAPVAKAALDKAGIAYEHYSEVSANPTVTVVNEIQKLYLETGCDGCCDHCGKA